MKKRRCFAFLLIYMFCCTTSAHAFSFFNEQTSPVHLKMQVDSLMGNPDNLPLLNDFFAPLSLALSLKDQSFALYREDMCITGLTLPLESEKNRTEGISTLFSHDLPSFFDFVQALEPDKEPTISKKTQKFEHVSSSTYEERYTLKKEQGNAILSKYKEQFKKYLSHTDFFIHNKFISALDTLSFTGNFTVVRLLNKEKAPMGLKLSTRVVDQNKAQSTLSVLLSKDDFGTHIAFSLKGTKGKNEDAFALSFKDTDSAFSYHFMSKYQKDTLLLIDEKEVKFTTKETQEGTQLKGEMRYLLNRNGNETTYICTPSILQTNAQLSGTAHIQKTYEKFTLYDVLLSLSPLKKNENKGQITDQMHTLSSDTDQTMYTAVIADIYTYISQYSQTLSEEHLRQFDHLLRNDTWMYGQSVPLPDNWYQLIPSSSAFTVLEEE